MRILTVRQPWAWAIIHGGKSVENRVRNIAGGYRGPVAIHAGLVRFNDDAFAESEPLYRALMSAGRRYRDGAIDDLRTLGAIIGVVDLVGVHLCKSSNRGFMTPVCFDDRTPIGSVCSEWAQFEPSVETHHLVLANPRPLTKPIPYKGALGLRTLDEATVALIAKQVQL